MVKGTENTCSKLYSLTASQNTMCSGCSPNLSKSQQAATVNREPTNNTFPSNMQTEMGAPQKQLRATCRVPLNPTLLHQQTQGRQLTDSQSPHHGPQASTPPEANSTGALGAQRSCAWAPPILLRRSTSFLPVLRPLPAQPAVKCKRSPVNLPPILLSHLLSLARLKDEVFTLVLLCTHSLA